MNQSQIVRYQIVYLVLLLLIALALVLNVNTGSVSMSPVKIFKIIFLGFEEGSVESNIIWRIRLPRALTAAILGGALSVSGFQLQAFFRNPIAGPFVLGISAGAKLAVALAIIFLLGTVSGISPYIMVLFAFLGSLLTTGVVLLFSQKTTSMSMLLVIGIMIGYICSAITDFMITFAKDNHIASLTYWSMGSFAGASWHSLRLITVVVAVGLMGSMLISKPMEAYQLGEGYAKSMGINIKLFRLILITLSSLLSATVTAFAGPISFVGIAVPHLAKMLMKTAKPLVIIPASFLCGASFCMFCDLVARTAFAPTELAIGTVTALFGAPVVISLMIKQRKSKQ